MNNATKEIIDPRFAELLAFAKGETDELTDGAKSLLAEQIQMTKGRKAKQQLREVYYTDNTLGRRRHLLVTGCSWMLRYL